MTIGRLALLLACLALLAPLPDLARAEEESDGGPLAARFFDVGALTLGHTYFIGPVMGTVSADMVSDEENPLFGGEGEEPMLPLGTVDELVELIQQNVDPVSWQITDGADIMSIGEGVLLVAASRGVLSKVEKYLAELESDLLTSVTVEIRAVRAPDPQDPFSLHTLVQSAGPSLTLTSVLGQRAVAWTGEQFSYVEDYDVEVAQSSDIADPIVGVANYGMSAAVTATYGTDASRLRVDLDATLALPTKLNTHVSNEKRLIELPAYEMIDVASMLLLEPGAWAVAEGGLPQGDTKGWVFFVRATPTRFLPRPVGRTLLFELAAPADSGPLVTRTFDVSDLNQPAESRLGVEINLVPSNFTPPEPPELPEPMPIVSADTLPDLLRVLVTPRSWNRDGTGIEERLNRISITNTERILGRVAETLERMRRQFLWSVVGNVRILEVPRSLADHCLAPKPLGGGYLLDNEERDLLLTADVRRLGQARLISLIGSRTAVFSGRSFPYVQDFEVELAESSKTSNPVVHIGREGLVADIHPALTSTGDAVNVAVRVSRGTLEELRDVPSPHGDIQAPRLGLFQVRTNLRVPLGETAIVGAGGDGDRVTLLLYTPTLERYGN